MKYIFLDMDGTIIDSKMGITKSVQYALKDRGIIIDDLDLLERHIGPPLKDGFMEYYGFPEAEAEDTIRIYRKYYNAKGIYEIELYEGIEELLKKLKAANFKVVVATSKLETAAKSIVEYFNLTDYFEDVCGASEDDTRTSKESVIRYALEKHKIGDLSQVIMVGDRRYDVEGAKAVGIPSIGVLYGYGDREELETAGADYIVENLEELFQLISKLNL